MLMAAAPVLIALFVAFAADPLAQQVASRPNELEDCLLQGIAGLAVSASLALMLGIGLSVEIRRRGHPTPATRRAVQWAAFLVQAMNLGVYAWLIHGLRWPSAVRIGMGLRGSLVLDEIMILLPYLVAELLGWWALFPAMRASRMPATPERPLAYVILKARQTFGMVLPLVILFWVGDRLTRRALPEMANSPIVRASVTIGVGILAVLITPAFVRLAWPSHPLPPGPLRERLERLSRRFGFRCSQIRLLDTGGTACNAFIAGALPWFRHVLLSDGLIEHLNDEEIEAVFGHEMGHVYHHHMLFIGLFALGSIGVLALFGHGIEAVFSVVGLGGTGQVMFIDLAKAGLVLVCVVVYLRLVFGPLSRRFEREADVFGCRAVSCGKVDCPPHLESSQREAGGHPDVFCPVAVRICINALETVAERSGLEIDAWGWRHGTIASRIDFLSSLRGRPTAGVTLHRDVLRFRMALVLVLASAMALAFLTGAFDGALVG
jgi:STE24 endopeptidase